MIGETPSKRPSGTTYRMSTNTSHSANMDLERVILQKQLNEERLLRELAYKQETLQLFQSEKNLKMDQYQLQVEEEMLRLKRRYEMEIDGLNRRALELERDLRESFGRIQDIESENQMLITELEGMTKELVRSNEGSKQQSSQLGKLNETVKQLQNLNHQMKQKNLDMEEEIMVLLQIETEKSKQILVMQENEKMMRHQVRTLEGALLQIEAHFKLTSQSLRNKEMQCQQLQFVIQKIDSDLQSRELTLQKVTLEFEEAVRRERVREVQVKQLMRENERLYNEVTASKHRLHDLAITYNFGL